MLTLLPAPGRLTREQREDHGLVAGLVEGAQVLGFDGDPFALQIELEERAAVVRGIRADADAAGGTDAALLKAIREGGGLSIAREDAQKGELAWLRSATRLKGIFTGTGLDRWGRRRGRSGLTLDGMVEYLRQDVRFQHITDIKVLVDALTDIATSDRDTDLTAADLGASRYDWWMRTTAYQEKATPEERWLTATLAWGLATWPRTSRRSEGTPRTYTYSWTAGLEAWASDGTFLKDFPAMTGTVIATSTTDARAQIRAKHNLKWVPNGALVTKEEVAA